MLEWVKRKLAARKAEERIKRYFAIAEGSWIERNLVAVALTEIDSVMDQPGQNRMTEDQRLVFMMTYECVVMWSLKCGIESSLSSREVESAVVAMRNHLAKHGWYQSGGFEKIWTAIQQIMPSAFTPTAEFGTVYPLGDMIGAADIAGFRMILPSDFEQVFGWYVIMAIRNLTNAGRQIAKEHIASTKRIGHEMA